MATAGSLVTDFVSQNALILIGAVLSTVLVIAASTYYVARNYMLSTTMNPTETAPSEQDETTSNVPPTNQSSAENTETEKEEEKGAGEPGGQDSTLKEPAIDPVYYCEHIQGEIKKVKQDVTTRKICENLSQEEIETEKKRQRDQLEEIFRLMQEQQERFGISSMEEMQDQMRLYSNF